MGFFRRLSYRMAAFMQGRYGYDELCLLLSVMAVVFFALSLFVPPHWLFYLIAFVFLALSWFRSLSKNIARRQKERYSFLKIKNKIFGFFRRIKNRFRDRKTHKYYKCPHCKVTVRVKKPPKGRVISITCPKCARPFDKKT